MRSLDREELFTLFLSALFVPKSVLTKGLEVAEEHASVSWETVLRLALLQNTHAIMYSNLRRIETDIEKIMPAAFMRSLRGHYYKAAGRDMILYHEFGSICETLDRTGIEFMPIKGTIVALTIYPERHLRPFRDIDLLLNASKLPPEAERELVGLGYKLNNPGFGTSPFFVKNTPAGPIHVEVHGQGHAWNRLHRSHQLDYSLIGRDLWRRAKTQHIQGFKVKSMSPEDMLLIACLNRADLADLRLMDINDLMGVVTRCGDSFDWQYVERKLSTSGATIVFHLLVGFIKSMYGLDVTPRWLGIALQDQVRNRIFACLFQRASILEGVTDFHILYLLYRTIFLDRYDIRHQFISARHLKNLLQTRIASKSQT